MKGTDRNYQDVVEEAARNLSKGDLRQLGELPPTTSQILDTRIGPLEFDIYHLPPDPQIHPYHSIILVASRPRWFLLKKRFVAGFSFDDLGVWLPLPEEFRCDFS